MVVCALGICGISRAPRARESAVGVRFHETAQRDRFFGRLDGEQHFAVPQEHSPRHSSARHENAAQPVALRLHPRAPLTDEKRTTGDVMRDG